MTKFMGIMAGIKQELNAQGIEISADEVLREHGGSMTNEELTKRHQEVLANAKPDDDGWDMYYCYYFGTVNICRMRFFVQSNRPGRVEVSGEAYPVPLNGGTVRLLGKVPRWEG